MSTEDNTLKLYNQFRDNRIQKIIIDCYHEIAKNYPDPRVAPFFKTVSKQLEDDIILSYQLWNQSRNAAP